MKNNGRGFLSISFDTSDYNGGSLLFVNDLKAARYNNRMKYNYVEESSRILETMRRKTMNREEILKEIKDVKNAIFMTEMIDHWSGEDSARYSRLCDKLVKLQKELEACDE